MQKELEEERKRKKEEDYDIEEHTNQGSCRFMIHKILVPDECIYMYPYFFLLFKGDNSGSKFVSLKVESS